MAEKAQRPPMAVTSIYGHGRSTLGNPAHLHHTHGEPGRSRGNFQRVFYEFSADAFFTTPRATLLRNFWANGERSQWAIFGVGESSIYSMTNVFFLYFSGGKKKRQPRYKVDAEIGDSETDSHRESQMIDPQRYCEH